MINLIFISDPSTDGSQLISDMRRITSYGPLDSFGYMQQFLNYETYGMFGKEALFNITCALAAIFVIMLLLTANLTVSLFILICVALVDLFLFALMVFWSVSYNTVTGLNIIAALGLAVDYSAHIGHAYLLVDEPTHDDEGRELTKSERRMYKAKHALITMGSSVFHGAFSTFLAILALAPAKSYIFLSFFKMWFGIVVFGVLNGFILLPVMLALIGPLKKAHSDDVKQETQKDEQVELGEIKI